MKSSNRSLLMVPLFIGLALSQIGMAKKAVFETASGSDVTCKEALQNVPKIKIEMKDYEALALLGDPTAIDKDVWVYNFFECAPPPIVGDQSVFGLILTFTDKVISKIDYATICATGPGNQVPRKVRPHKH